MYDFNMESDMESMAIRSILANKALYNPMTATNLDKEKDFNEVYQDATAAFLGPNIWDKSAEFKMDYLDLDALLNGSENERKLAAACTMSDEKIQQQLQQISGQDIPNITDDIPNIVPIVRPKVIPPSPDLDSSSLQEMPSSDGDSRMYSLDCKFSPRDLALCTPPGQEHYDPTSSSIPEDELKPQPIIKKSRKTFVPDKLKDDKYWARRHKNNIAARRSREARRLKENQIVLRASYLEKENNSLKEDVMRLKAENDMLKNQLKKYQS